MSKLIKVFAARNFGWEEREVLDIGEVVDVDQSRSPRVAGGETRLQQMLRLGHFRRVESEPVQCGRCGHWFADASYLNRHGKARHDRSAIDVGRSEMASAISQQVDRARAFGGNDNVDMSIDSATAQAIGDLRALEAQDEFAAKALPLNLDKTAASRKERRASR